LEGGTDFTFLGGTAGAAAMGVLFTLGFAAGFAEVLTAGLAAGLVGVLTAALATGFAGALTASLAAGLVAVLGAGLAIGLEGALTTALATGLEGALTAILAIGLAGALETTLAAGWADLADLDAGIVNLGTKKNKQITQQPPYEPVRRLGRRTGTKEGNSTSKMYGRTFGLQSLRSGGLVIGVTAWPGVRRCCCRSCRERVDYTFSDKVLLSASSRAARASLRSFMAR